jgi:hypothetical protein
VFGFGFSFFSQIFVKEKLFTNALVRREEVVIRGAHSRDEQTLPGLSACRGLAPRAFFATARCRLYAFFNVHGIGKTSIDPADQPCAHDHGKRTPLRFSFALRRLFLLMRQWHFDLIGFRAVQSWAVHVCTLFLAGWLIALWRCFYAVRDIRRIGKFIARPPHNPGADDSGKRTALRLRFRLGLPFHLARQWNSDAFFLGIFQIGVVSGRVCRKSLRHQTSIRATFLIYYQMYKYIMMYLYTYKYVTW